MFFIIVTFLLSQIIINNIRTSIYPSIFLVGIFSHFFCVFKGKENFLYFFEIFIIYNNPLISRSLIFVNPFILRAQISGSLFWTPIFEFHLFLQSYIAENTVFNSLIIMIFCCYFKIIKKLKEVSYSF